MAFWYKSQKLQMANVVFFQQTTQLHFPSFSCLGGAVTVDCVIRMTMALLLFSFTTQYVYTVYTVCLEANNRFISK